MESENMAVTSERLRRDAERALTAFEEQQNQLRDIVSQLTTLRPEAHSADGLVTVVVNAAGHLLTVRLADDAFRQTTPQQLSRSIAEAAVSGARLAGEQSDALFASMTAGADDLVDMLESVPGVKELHALRKSLVAEMNIAWQGPGADPDEADDACEYP